MTDTPEDRDYAAVKTEELLLKFDEDRIPLTHLGQPQYLIRLAILEAMRDQRHACAHEYQSVVAAECRPPYRLDPGARVTAILQATVTVKAEEEAK